MSGVSFIYKKSSISIISEFYSIKTISELADLLVKVEDTILFEDESKKQKKILSKHLYYLARNSNSKYRTFTIQKKNGGVRTIDAPDLFLKRIQRSLNVLLQIIFYPDINYYANGFLYGRGIIRNAFPHINKRYVLNMDIANFFSSIEFRRIKTVLQLNPFNLKDEREEIGFIIANICCLNGFLPQGAPTSPILSNLVTQNLDRKLSNLSKQLKIRYSRYADDITFSSNQNIFDSNLVDSIEHLVQSENFQINGQKTRLKSNRDHQEVTGIVTNEKINVRRKLLKNVRTMLNNWEKGGLDNAKSLFQIKESRVQNDNFVNVLNGRIAYIGMVRGKDDPLYQRLNLRFGLLKNRISYDNITNDRVKLKLIRDNQKMEKILIDRVHETDLKFIAFCTSAFHQIENLINYYYWVRFPIMTDLLQFLINENPSFAKRYKTLDKCKNLKHIGMLNINVLVYLYEKEFYFDKKIHYKQELKMLRDIRNDDSHRCEVKNFDRGEVVEKFKKLEIKWKKFRLKHSKFPKKTENEKEIEYQYRLLQFLDQKNYNSVRRTIKLVAKHIQSNTVANNG